MTQNPDVFCSAHARQFLRRAASRFSSHDFLYTWAARDIAERLQDIKRVFSKVLVCGARGRDVLGDRYPNATYLTDVTPEALLDYAGQFDLIVSLGDLHRANDLPGVLIQLRRALVPDGVMMAAFAGGETLRELRESLLHAEMDVLGGASPRVFPFADKQQMAALMQRAGFALPVVDSELLNVSYRDMFHVIDEVRGMGESNSLMNRYTSLTPSRLFYEAARYYQDKFAESDGRVQASFEILFLIGWAPHESQQKPARRGSGQVSLTDVL